MINKNKVKSEEFFNQVKDKKIRLNKWTRGEWFKPSTLKQTKDGYVMVGEWSNNQSDNEWSVFNGFDLDKDGTKWVYTCEQHLDDLG